MIHQCKFDEICQSIKQISHIQEIIMPNESAAAPKTIYRSGQEIRGFVCVEVLRPSQPMGSCRAWSVYLTTRLLGRRLTSIVLTSKRLTSIVHIPSPETDNCPS